MTLFPDAIDAMMGQSIIGRAQARGLVTITAHQIREYTTNKQMQVDDYPYGGGRGAVMQADPLYRCWNHICQEAGERVHTIYLSPCGRVFDQQVAKELKAAYERLILVCGHYEGIDQRFIDECVDEEISIGDFVLTAGRFLRWLSRTQYAAWCRAFCRTRKRSRRKATGTACSSIRSTPVRKTGAAEKCRRCCFPGTMPILKHGDAK